MSEEDITIYNDSFKTKVINHPNKRMSFKQLLPVASFEDVCHDHGGYSRLKMADIYLLESRLLAIDEEDIKVCGTSD